MQTVSWLQEGGQSVAFCYRVKLLAPWSASSTTYTSSTQTSNWAGVCKAHRGAALNILWYPLRWLWVDIRYQQLKFSVTQKEYSTMEYSCLLFTSIFTPFSAPVWSPAPEEYRCPPQGCHLICTCCLQLMPDRRAELNSQQAIAQQCEWSLNLLWCIQCWCILNCVRLFIIAVFNIHTLRFVCNTWFCSVIDHLVVVVISLIMIWNVSLFCWGFSVCLPCGFDTVFF